MTQAQVSEGSVSARRALLAIRDAMDRAGMPHGDAGEGAIGGWTRRPYTMDTTCMNVEPWKDGLLRWHVTLSGRPHLEYRSWRERDEAGEEEGDEFSSPVDPEILFGRIADAVRSVGLEPTGVEYASAQTLWDDGVGYAVLTRRPAWLESVPERDGHPVVEAGAPTLCTWDLRSAPGAASHPLDGLLASVQGEGVPGLVGYEASDGDVMLTRESVEALAAVPVRGEDGWSRDAEGRTTWRAASTHYAVLEPRAGGGADFVLMERAARTSGSDRVPHATPVETLRVPAGAIRNAWGDEVAVWRMPPGSLQRQAGFHPAQPVTIGGETRSDIGFREWDAQFGPAPWNPDGMAAVRIPRSGSLR